MTLAELIEQGLELPPAERYVLASRLLAQTDGVPEKQTSVDAAWKAELRHRLSEISAGNVDLIDHSETVRAARSRISARHI